MNAPTARQVRKTAYETGKLEKRLRRLAGQAIADYDMIRAGDRVMVCLSGGKDSYGLLDILLKLRDAAPLDFEIVAVNLDQRHPGYPEHVLPEYLGRLGIPFRIEQQDTYSVVKRVIPEGATMCGLCSRLRRGVLYRVAGELGATKIALGHHRDDILETFFLNLFFGGKLKAMPPKLASDDGRHVVIRPLAYVPGGGSRGVGGGAAVSDHPVQPVRVAGEPAARAGEADAARVGEALPGPGREHLPRARERRAVASSRPGAVTTSPGSARPAHPIRRATARSIPTPRRRDRHRCAGD